MNDVCLSEKISQNSHQGYSAQNGGSYPCLDEISPEIVLGWPEYSYDSVVDPVVARYYDATIGRFISADTIVPEPYNPQSLNRYSYCLNNPLRYTDPSGHDVSGESTFGGAGFSLWYAGSTMEFAVTDDHGGVGILKVERKGISPLWDVWFSIKESFWLSADTILDLMVSETKFVGGQLSFESFDYLTGKEMDGDEYHGYSEGQSFGLNPFGNIFSGKEYSILTILKCPYGGPEAYTIDLPVDSSDGPVWSNSTSPSSTAMSDGPVTVYPTCADCIAYLNNLGFYLHPVLGWSERVDHPSGMYSYERVDDMDEAVE